MDAPDSSGTPLGRWPIIVAVATALVLIVLMLRGLSIHDSEETVFRDPRDRTAFRMDLIGSYLDSLEMAGSLPRSGDDFDVALSHGRPNGLRMDAWNHVLSFQRVGTGYELRSAGPDGQYGTADDITRRSRGR